MTPNPAPTRLLPLIWSVPLYRAAFISLFISGFAFASTTPLLTKFLVDHLDVSLPVASLFYLTNLAVPVAGVILGRYSDIMSGRMPLMRWCTVATAIGWLAMAVVTHLWMALIISATAFGIGSASIAILFAALRDEMSFHPTRLDTRLMTTIRLAYTGGWIAGPVYGGWFSDRFDLRALFLVASVIHLLSIVPVLKLNPPRFVNLVTLPTSLGKAASASGLLPLILFAILCTIALSGNNVKFSFLPIYANDDLRISAAVVGTILAIQPVFEVIAMIIFGMLADRFGALPMIATSILIGTSSYAVFAISESAPGLFAAQILGAALNAAVIGLGIVVAQEIYPRGVGLASSVFYSSIGVSSTLGGLVGAAGVARFGLPGVFYVPAILCLLVFAGMLLLAPMLRKPA